MKVLQSIHVVLAVSTVFGSARGEEKGGDVQCPVCSIRGAEKPAGFERFISMVLICTNSLLNPSLEEHLQAANTTDEYREAVKGYCDKVSTYNECIFATKDLAKRCLPDPIEAEMIIANANFIHHMLNVSCEQDGARLISVIMRSYARPPYRNSRRCLNTCLNNALRNIYCKPSTLGDFKLHQYQVLTTFKTCLVDVEEEMGEPVEDLMAILNEAADAMSCIDKASGNEVLCKTVVEDRHGADDKISRVSHDFYRIYSMKGLDCYMKRENRNRISTLLAKANSTDEYQVVVEEICDTKNRSVEQCILKTKLYAEIFVQGKNFGIFNKMMDLLEMVHIVACKDESFELADMLAKIRSSLPKNDRFIYVCFLFTIRTLKRELDRKLTYDWLIPNLPMKRFTGCVASYQRRLNPTVAEVALLLDERVEQLSLFDKSQLVYMYYTSD